MNQHRSRGRRLHILRQLGCVSSLAALAVFALTESAPAEASDRRDPTIPATFPTVSFAYSAEISPSSAAAFLIPMNQASVRAEADHVVVIAQGEDAQLNVKVEGASMQRLAVLIDIGSPVDTLLELFYQTQNGDFSAQRVARATLKTGRNRVLLEIDDPGFNGTMRLDPGQSAGEYTLYSFVVFSPNPVEYARKVRSQEELAEAFAASKASVYAARTPEDFGKLRALKDLTLKPKPGGLELNATGTDPSLVLPQLDVSRAGILRVAIVSPADTALQVFYRVSGQSEYDQARSRGEALKRGPNVIYLEQPTTKEPIRLDPGNVAGSYLLTEVELRSTEGAP